MLALWSTTTCLWDRMVPKITSIVLVGQDVQVLKALHIPSFPRVIESWQQTSSMCSPGPNKRYPMSYDVWLVRNLVRVADEEDLEEEVEVVDTLGVEVVEADTWEEEDAVADAGAEVEGVLQGGFEGASLVQPRCIILLITML